MLRFKKITAPLIAVALIAAGCETTADGGSAVSAGAVGGALGAVAGGLAGTQIGGGRGRTAAIIGGTVLGGIVGAAVAQRISDRGKQAAIQTTQQTLSTGPVGQPATWRDPVNPQIYGTVTPTSQPYYVNVDAAPYLGPVQSQRPAYAQARPAPYGQPGYGQPQAYATSQSIECRDYQTAVFSGGQPETLTGRMCRNGPGQPWRPANNGPAGI